MDRLGKYGFREAHIPSKKPHLGSVPDPSSNGIRLRNWPWSLRQPCR